MGDRELNNQNPFSRFLRFRDVRYLKHHFGDVIYSVKIVQLVTLLVTFLAWIIEIFSSFEITN